MLDLYLCYLSRIYVWILNYVYVLVMHLAYMYEYKMHVVFLLGLRLDYNTYVMCFRVLCLMFGLNYI